MNNSFEHIASALKNRQSVFPNMYTDEPIDDSVIANLLELANFAPTHKLTQPWRYIVISGLARKRLGEYMAEEYKLNTRPDLFSQRKYLKQLENPQKASHILAIVMQRDPNESIPEWEEIAAVSCSVQNIWIAACSLGFGCYWSSPAVMIGRPAFLPLEDGEKCLGLFYLGKHRLENPLPKLRTPMSEKIRFLKE